MKRYVLEERVREAVEKNEVRNDGELNVKKRCSKVSSKYRSQKENAVP